MSNDNDYDEICYNCQYWGDYCLGDVDKSKCLLARDLYDKGLIDKIDDAFVGSTGTFLIF